jgi:hypothetical protein
VLKAERYVPAIGLKSSVVKTFTQVSIKVLNIIKQKQIILSVSDHKSQIEYNIWHTVLKCSFLSSNCSIVNIILGAFTEATRRKYHSEKWLNLFCQTWRVFS